MKYLVYFCLFMAIITHLVSCDSDCNNPTRKECVERKCHFTMIWMGRSWMPTTRCKCVEYKEVPNECYRG